MAPLPDALLSLLPRAFLAATNHAPTINSDMRSLSPREVQMLHLAKRAPSLEEHGAGASPPANFNNVGIQVVFALIGTGMVLTALWFFFWAKNGGFRFRDDDWEDYKSTVLRRKGPDGKTLSNATKSTRLGGGSVVHGGSYGDESSVGYTEETATSADMSEVREAEEGHGRHFGLRGGDAGKKKQKSRREGANDYKDNDLRGYREERPARVGGLNRKADGVYTDYSTTNGSALGSNVSSQPLVAPPTDKKKEAKAKELRARERMRQAKLIEKNAAKTAAAEAKARKIAEKEQAKKDKEQQKRGNRSRRAEIEATPSEAPMTEVTPSEAPLYKAPMSEAPMSEAPMSEAPMSEAPRHSRRAPPSAAYSFITGDDTNTVYSGAYTDNRTAPSEDVKGGYYNTDYRPKTSAPASSSSPTTRPRRERQSQSESRNQSRHSSPRKERASRDSDIFTQTNGNKQGTISYPCHIPGLSSAGSAAAPSTAPSERHIPGLNYAGSVAVSDSISQVAGRREREARRGRDVMDGYRRGGARTVNRRDSLSESD